MRPVVVVIDDHGEQDVATRRKKNLREGLT
jgi:hypothetical protein